MRVLHLMPYCPLPPNFGGALRMYHLLKNLVKRHEVTAVCYGTHSDREAMVSTFGCGLRAVHVVPPHWLTNYRRLGQLSAYCSRKSYFSLLTHQDRMQQVIDQLLSREEYDIVQSEFPMMGMFRLNTAAVKILDAHNVEYANFRRMSDNAHSLVRRLHYLRESKSMHAEEIRACRNQDAMFVTSLPDKEIFDSEVPHLSKFVIPNGVDMSYFRSSSLTREPHSMVFTGMMAYVPNYDAMLHFLDDIFPLIRKRVPDAKVYIVGNRPPMELSRRASADVVVTGYVDDVRPFIDRASVYIVPLRMGSGTRLKILEAMAMQIPVVTTSIGCEGIEVGHGTNAFLESAPEAFADRVVRLMKDADLRRTTVRSAYDLVSSRYDWSIVGEQVERAYCELVATKPDRHGVMDMEYQTRDNFTWVQDQ